MGVSTCTGVTALPSQLGRDAPAAQIHHGLGHGLQALLGDEGELGQRIGGRDGDQFRQAALAHVVGLADDGALGRLAEHLLKFEGGRRARGDQVGQHRARAHRRQLEDIAHQDQVGRKRQGLDQVAHEQGIDHGGLVHDQRLGLQGFVLVALEAPFGQVEAQQLVQGGRRPAGDFGHAPGGPAGGRGQQILPAHGGQDGGDGPDQGGLAGAGPAGDDHDAVVKDALQDGQLGRRQLDRQALDHRGHDALGIHGRGRHGDHRPWPGPGGRFRFRRHTAASDRPAAPGASGSRVMRPSAANWSKASCTAW